MAALEVQVCIATPDSVAAHAWTELEGTLDAAERQQCDRFRVEADARAYVLAHGLRRALLARELGVAPGSLRFAADSNGKPVLVTPIAPSLAFSHSRNRHAVALAFTRAGSVGIDLEFVDAEKADFALLDPFVDLPARTGDTRNAQEFYRRWTVLEAFWKASGEGLRSGNPRILWRARGNDEFEIATPAGSHAVARARAVAMDDAPGCIATVALLQSQAQPFDGGELELVHCDSPFGYLRTPAHPVAP